MLNLEEEEKSERRVFF